LAIKQENLLPQPPDAAGASIHGSALSSALRSAGSGLRSWRRADFFVKSKDRATDDMDDVSNSI